FLFFFSSRRRHTRWPRDWSSDVCSSDLFTVGGGAISADDVSFSSRVNVDDLGNPIVPTYKGSPVAPAYATVTLASAALLGSVAGGTVIVANSPTVETGVGSGTSVDADGTLTVKSDVYQRSQADALSVALGIG